MIDSSKIWNSSQLPSLPSVAIRLLELLKDPDAEVTSVAEVIKADAAISAKVLKFTNSSFVGFSCEVTSIDRAVMLLGTNAVTSLALSFSLDEASLNRGPLAEHYQAYWIQSLVQAVAAELIGQQYGRNGLECQYFLTGLLADLGRLAMLKTIPQDYCPVLTAAQEGKTALGRLETEMLGINHVEIGVKLMKTWNLPEALISAVQFHHANLDELEKQAHSEEYDLIKATAVASAVGEYFCSENKGPALEKLQTLTRTFYEFSQSRLEEYLNQTRKEIDDVGDLFSVETESLGDPGDLMAQANEHLVQLALRQHVASTQATAQKLAAERARQEMELQNQRLQQQVMRDPLTRIYNRHFFEEALHQEIARCCRTAKPVGLIFIDIDRFKTINDTFGHPFGDRVLQRVACTLARIIRNADVLARYGGEEFAILAHQPTETGLAHVAERIRARVEAERIDFDNDRVPVTVSVGAAVALPGRQEEDLGERLLAAADEATYVAKKNGRNSVHVRSLVDEKDRRLAESVTARRFSRWLVRHKVIDVASASKALRKCHPRRVRIGDLAKQRGYLDEDQVERVLHELDKAGERFGEAAIRLGFLTEAQLAQLLALQIEDPTQLGQALVQMRVLGSEEVAILLSEYLAETSPQAPRSDPRFEAEDQTSCPALNSTPDP